MEENEGSSTKTDKRKFKIFIRVFIALCLIIGALYGAGVYWFKTHFQLNSFISGVDVSFMTPVDAEKELKNKIQLKSLRIKGRDNDQDVDVSDALIYYRFSGFEEALYDQDELRWPFMFVDKAMINLPYTLTFDEELLRACLDKSSLLDEENTIYPQDAYISFDEENGQYVIIQETEGNLIDKDRLYEVVSNNLSSKLSTVDLEKSKVFEEPEIRADDTDLLKKTELLNTLNNLKVSVDLGAGTIEYPNMEQLLGFIGTDCEPDEEQLRKYVALLAQKYDTYDTDTKRDFITHDGRIKSLYADYGWKLDQDKTYEALYQLISMITDEYKTLLTEAGYADLIDLAGLNAYPDEILENALDTEAILDSESNNQENLPDESKYASLPAQDGVLISQETENQYSVEAVWEKAAYSHSENNYGDTYIEVDMSIQQVYVFKNGSIVMEIPCVTGKMSEGRATPEGIYSIQYKQQNRYLVGRNPDGSERYRSYVHYWMPFNDGVGLHDATWRSQFGGNIYISGGSHGCVNLPLSQAVALYNIAYAGMPVICYY